MASTVVERKGSGGVGRTALLSVTPWVLRLRSGRNCWRKGDRPRRDVLGLADALMSRLFAGEWRCSVAEAEEAAELIRHTLPA
jgi:hypothetical protein